MNKIKYYDIAKVNNIKILGRTTKNKSPLTLYYTASGIELNVSGSELYIDIHVQYGCFEPWLCFIVNGEPISRFMTPEGDSRICVFRGMDEKTVKNVKIIKESQPLEGQLLQIAGISTDGEFFEVPDRKYKIEFIGDSITSGEGAIGSKCEMDWIPMWFSAVNDYAYMTAERLNADYRICSQSGWGVCSAWDNNVTNNIPKYYEQVCCYSDIPGAIEKYDFSEFKPDIVSIYLCANDAAAYKSPEWVDPDSGIAYKNRLNEDGSPCDEDLAVFKAGVADFVCKVRKNNPDSFIFWICGGLAGTMLSPALREVIGMFAAEGERIELIELPELPEETIGARRHPGIKAHKFMTNIIAERFAAVLK